MQLNQPCLEWIVVRVLPVNGLGWSTNWFRLGVRGGLESGLIMKCPGSAVWKQCMEVLVYNDLVLIHLRAPRPQTSSR